MNLNRAKNDARELLANANGELVSIKPYDQRIWLGVGYCVAKGWAVYRGDDHYNITTAGLEAHRKHVEGDADRE